MALHEPIWLQNARADLGLREIPGAPTAPRIAEWLSKLRAWWRDDETPWCGVAVAGWMVQSGIDALPKHWYRARGWLDWGLPLDRAFLGAIVVFEREGGGHVGIVVGRDHLGRLLVIGGNQGNAVSIAPFLPERVLGYRWPPGRRFDAIEPPASYTTAAASRNEA